MQFTPKTDKEIAEANLWPLGTLCGFEVIEHVTFGDKVTSTCDTTSKNGNEMIVLVLNVFNDKGETKVLLDYLLESVPAKLKAAATVCGLLDKYESGQLYAADFVGKKGDLKIGIDKGADKNDGSGEKYPDRNKIAGYVVDKTAANKPAVHPALDDEIPF